MSDTRVSPLLAASGVSKLIDDQVLLAPVEVTVDAGECVAVLGENGAGKTTLLRILAGTLLPSHGEVSFAGERVDARRRSVREGISSLIGVPAFYPDLTVREHLRLITASWSVPVPEGEDLVAEVLDQFGIGPLASRFPHELSSGQTQMFHLAATFIRPFSVLILDEPEQRLDPGRKHQLVGAVLRAKRRGAAVVFTSHDAAVVERVADRTITLTGA